MAAAGLRAALAAAAASVALGLGVGGASFLGDRTAAKKALVATVFEHNRVAPVDIMLGHQLRMLSSTRKNVAQVAVINAKVPGVDNVHGTAQDPVLAQMSRSYGTTGAVQVVDLEGDLEKKVEMMQKVFSITEGSTAAFAKQFFKQEPSTPELKREMARFTAMLHFFDLCSKADYGIDVCVGMQTESLVYRKDKKGLLELASELFDNDEEVVALQPPTYCDYTQARHRPGWAKASQWTNSSFTKCQANATKARLGEATDMIFSRERLSKLLPFSVTKDQLRLDKGFDHAFWIGMGQSGNVKGMQCGHSFVIHPATEKTQCKGKQFLIQKLANQNALSATKMAESRAKLDTLSGEYSLMDQVVVKGVEVLLDRVENGLFPHPSGNVGNKCQDMCPSSDSIVKEGLAW